MENAGVENLGAIKHEKPPEEKTIQYQWCKLKRIGLKQGSLYSRLLSLSLPHAHHSGAMSVL